MPVEFPKENHVHAAAFCGARYLLEHSDVWMMPIDP